MKKALQLAEKGRGLTSPNPMVGALVVKKNKILGKGYHKKYGDHHAEVNAIRSCKESLKGATLYTTLEPCCHTKKQTPPCTNLLIESGFKEVVIGSLDVNPEVNGKGVKILEKAGIKVTHGVLAKEEEYLNEVFRKNMLTGMPFIHLKIAQTLDGKVATNSFDSKWITDEDARKSVHELRSRYQGICIGRGTVDLDNPFLNIRYGMEKKFPWPKVLILGEPTVDSRNLNIYKTHRQDSIFVFTNNKMKETNPNFTYFNSPKMLMDKIYTLGVHSFLVEGGSKTFSYFMEKKCFDKVTIYQSSSVLGGGIGPFDQIGHKLMKSSTPLKLHSVTQINNQLKLDLYPNF